MNEKMENVQRSFGENSNEQTTSSFKECLKRAFAAAPLLFSGSPALGNPETLHAEREMTVIENPYSFVSKEQVEKEAPDLAELIDAAEKGIPEEAPERERKKLPSYVDALQEYLEKIPRSEMKEEWAWAMRLREDNRWYPVVLGVMNNGSGGMGGTFPIPKEFGKELHIWHPHLAENAFAFSMTPENFTDANKREKGVREWREKYENDPNLWKGLMAPPSFTDLSNMAVRFSNNPRVQLFVDAPSGIYRFSKSGENDENESLIGAVVERMGGRESLGKYVTDTSTKVPMDDIFGNGKIKTESLLEQSIRSNKLVYNIVWKDVFSPFIQSEEEKRAIQEQAQSLEQCENSQTMLLSPGVSYSNARKEWLKYQEGCKKLGYSISFFPNSKK